MVDQDLDSPGLSVAAPETAAWLSLTAYARHTMTDDDVPLAEATTATARASSSPLAQAAQLPR